MYSKTFLSPFGKTAEKAGVPIVPGTPGPVAKYEDGWSFVEEHGYPGEFLSSPTPFV